MGSRENTSKHSNAQFTDLPPASRNRRQKRLERQIREVNRRAGTQASISSMRPSRTDVVRPSGKGTQVSAPVIRVRLPRGKGYRVLARKVTQAMQAMGYDKFKVSARRLRVQMQNQMVHPTTYKFDPAELLSGGPVSAGRTAKQLRKDQRGMKWWENGGREKTLAEIRARKVRQQQAMQTLLGSGVQAVADGVDTASNGAGAILNTLGTGAANLREGWHAAMSRITPQTQPTHHVKVPEAPRSASEEPKVQRGNQVERTLGYLSDAITVVDPFIETGPVGPLASIASGAAAGWSEYQLIKEGSKDGLRHFANIRDIGTSVAGGSSTLLGGGIAGTVASTSLAATCGTVLAGIAVGATVGKYLDDRFHISDGTSNYLANKHQGLRGAQNQSEQNEANEILEKHGGKGSVFYRE